MNGISFVDEPRSGAENMAIDQQLLELAAERQQVILRTYQWSAPTLSLGYFQKHAEIQQFPSLAGLDMVRRATGGGAIVHHHDWTYSISVPNQRLGSQLGASQALYDCIHVAIVDWLQELGLNACQWSQTPCATRQQDCSFLCFERRSRGDVVVEHSKVLGSAQRRGKGALLQHGSLLLACSPFATSLAGILELLSGVGRRQTVLDYQEFHQRLVQCVDEQFGLRLEAIPQIPLNCGNPVDCGRFADPHWNTSR